MVKRRVSGNRKIQTVKIDHIPMLVRDLEEKGTKEAIDE